MAACGGERAGKAEFLERIEVGRKDLGGGGVREEIREEENEAADEGRVGVGLKMTAIIPELRQEPDGGGAAGNAVGRSAAGGGKGRPAAGAVDGGSEAFLRVVVERNLVEERLLSRGERHGGRRVAERGLISKRSWPLIC